MGRVRLRSAPSPKSTFRNSANWNVNLRNFNDASVGIYPLKTSKPHFNDSKLEINI